MKYQFLVTSLASYLKSPFERSGCPIGRWIFHEFRHVPLKCQGAALAAENVYIELTGPSEAQVPFEISKAQDKRECPTWWIPWHPPTSHASSHWTGHVCIDVSELRSSSASLRPHRSSRFIKASINQLMNACLCRSQPGKAASTATPPPSRVPARAATSPSLALVS